MTNAPVAVQEFGQSIWLDNLSRDIIRSGELQRLIDEDGVVGITTNPSIFEKAVSGGSGYDDTILRLLDEEDPHVIYEALALEDVAAAADILRPVYERTRGLDGYVSLEVSPFIAHDTEATVEEAQRLYKALGRPNVFIKIPATPEGIPAIEASIAAGVSVNVTLIFALQNYAEVAQAYIRGLERRKAAGEPVERIASVASFFLSRIDTYVDRELPEDSPLRGKAAIASARLAYAHFEATFRDARFRALEQAGARLQRVLWASTSTKNPAYPDLHYVEPLIGPHTVNTMPPHTLAAFKDHGTAALTLTQGLNEAHDLMQDLARAGVDLDAITAQLQADGVAAFADAFRKLLDGVRARRDALRAAQPA
ncbi:MAG: transaldolase [Anaerolineae bacterium]